MRYAILLVLMYSIAALDAAELESAAPVEVQKIYVTLIGATEENDLNKFHSVCDQTMKAAITKDKLKVVSDSFTSNRKNGENCKYLGFYSQKNGTVYLYKIPTKDPSVDFLVTLSVINNQCNGFYIR